MLSESEAPIWTEGQQRSFLHSSLTLPSSLPAADSAADYQFLQATAVCFSSLSPRQSCSVHKIDLLLSDMSMLQHNHSCASALFDLCLSARACFNVQRCTKCTAAMNENVQ